jgi:hypothetical protein
VLQLLLVLVLVLPLLLLPPLFVAAGSNPALQLQRWARRPRCRCRFHRCI